MLHLIYAPWWLPKAITGLYVKLSMAVGITLSKLGMHAPYILDEFFGPTAGIGSVAIPVRDYWRIVEAAEVHTVLGTDGGAVTLTIEKLTGTQAPGAGANMLQTSTFNLKATINTVQRVAVSSLTAVTVAQRAAMDLSPGDRIGLTFTGTLTSLAGVGVTVIFKRNRFNPAR